MINLIVCMGKNREIGINNDMPWGRGLPADLAYFKHVTKNQDVAMGRKTFQSILSSLGKPLPERNNIVLTENESFSHPGVEVVNSIEGLIEQAKRSERNLFIIGGATIYSQFMDVADRLYVTRVNESFGADTYFPTIDASTWTIRSKVEHKKDERNMYDYAFIVFEKTE